MPSRNTSRQDLPDSYYHVYTRGNNRMNIFVDPSDKDYFLYLVSRHLSNVPIFSKQGYEYPHYRNKIELLAYCLMDNHIHLLVYQIEPRTLSQLMRSVMTAYSSYFNRKHLRTGPLLESRFKASLIDRDSYLLHISRYVHLNPRDWRKYSHSSLKHIRKATEPDWLQSERLLAEYGSRDEYVQFVADYEENKQVLSEIKKQLAC